MQAIKITENIYWVGAIDWSLRNFHGYLTQRGSTYNAYLIIDEKITLIDTVKHYCYDEMLARISSVIDPKKIDYVISNHVEMDHSGALPQLMELIPNATIFTSPQGDKGLKLHYKKDWNFQVVQNNQTLSLGKNNLQFVLTQMVHWPDNMVSYLPEQQILFSNDAFGQHLATPQRFDDEIPLDILMEEAAKYYANIVLPYGKQVTKAFESLQNLKITTIAPSHGLIWRKHIPEILSSYQKWMHYQAQEKAVIIYDTMWDSTAKIAQAILAGFELANIPAEICALKDTHLSDIMTKILEAKYICVGSPTLNNNLLPTVAQFLTYFKGLAPQNRIAIPFGSYGWGGQSISQIADIFTETGCKILTSFRVNYVPDNTYLNDVTQNVVNELTKLKNTEVT